MRIVVHMFLNFECLTSLFHFQANDDIQVFCFGGSLFVIFSVLVKFGSVSILHIIAGMMAVSLNVYALGYKVVAQFVEHIVLAGKVYHRTCFARLVYQEE